MNLRGLVDCGGLFFPDSRMVRMVLFFSRRGRGRRGVSTIDVIGSLRVTIDVVEKVMSRS